MKSQLCLGLALVMSVVIVAPAPASAAGKGCKSQRVTLTHYRAAPKAAKPADIVDTAVAAGSFKTLATALKAAGLVDTLKSDGPFTVFAPTDEAFAKLPEGTVEALLKDIPKLQAILKYHVVAGKVTAAQVVKLNEAETVGGKMVKIDATDGVKVNNAKVVKADVMASNGVIHVVDTVLIPE